MVEAHATKSPSHEDDALRPPRTVHLLARRSGGGTETNVARLCERTPGFERLALEEALGTDLSPTRLPAAVRALRAREPEVVFCYGLAAHLVAVAAYPFGGPPLVGNVRGEIDFAGWKAPVRCAIASRFRFWVSNSRAALAGERGIVIRNGVDPPLEPEEPMLRGFDPPVLGVLASGHPVKGHDWLLGAWSAAGCPGTLVFAGTLPAPLRRRAETAGAICTGWVEAGAFLRSLDLLLVPSFSEGLPTVIPEAMVRGVPVLATPVGGIPEILRHGQNGFLLPHAEWTDFLARLDSVPLARVGRGGERFARRHLRFSRMQARFVAVARRAAGKAVPRSVLTEAGWGGDS